MATAKDVATYILRERGPMTAMKLQKLVYYSQAWHLVWDEEPLFDERIEAWANGPVVSELYRAHRGRFSLNDDDTLGGDPSALTEGEHETIRIVLDAYGDKSARWLSELTHREAPWREARKQAGLEDGQRGSAIIEQAAMYEFYDGLTAADADTEDV
ncbi:Panacea domain-containing protein [Haloactinomyces albus]|uniref:Phage-associated protein n=1 Tax=Haloactinomyces albus TaxID=1352928 RepID=A0AAE3ZFE9_9ACTN|nr:type II toxin-antitoxin system antitoxin SocA domain-containing protein [Haloactinomyces albus]MDR7302257.1 putative phage-associated protein [Haloactinomyces albus]